MLDRHIDPDYEMEYTNFEAEQLQEKIDKTVYWMELVVDILYGKEEWNKEHFKDGLGEALHHLGMQLPSGNMIIDKEVK